MSYPSRPSYQEVAGGHDFGQQQTQAHGTATEGGSVMAGAAELAGFQLRGTSASGSWKYRQESLRSLQDTHATPLSRLCKLQGGR
jgi:hypothetical protein